jgi:uncharacterized protein YycO
MTKDSEASIEPSSSKDGANRKRALGQITDRVGILGLPLTFGMVLGFYLSDRGVRFMPTLASIVLLSAALSLLCLALARLLKGTGYAYVQRERVIRKSVSFFLVLAVLLISGRLFVFWSEQDSPLTAMETEDFDKAFSFDLQQYRILTNGLNESVSFLEGQKSIFVKDKVLSVDDEELLLDSWASVYNYSIALDQIRLFYEDWYRFDISRNEFRYHLRSFLLTFAAELNLYETAARLVNLIGKNSNAEKFLNAAHAEQGLPDDSLSIYRQILLGNRDHARVIAGREYLRFLRAGFDGFSRSVDLGIPDIWKDIESNLALVTSRSKLLLTLSGIQSDIEPLRRKMTRVWYPTQSKVAEVMGDTRVRRIGRYLISPEQLEEMDLAMEPGDILLARKNWYLSNVGLPGFWPHAELYLGSSKKLEAYFDDPSVKAYWITEDPSFESFGQYLEDKFPQAWWQYQAHGSSDALRVMEATSDGVILSTLYHAAGDYIAALRPNLSKVAKSQAIVEAFTHFGKPYDFNFDFATKETLVCTELVWRAYQPSDNKDGLTFPLIQMVGRFTLPANNIAELYASERRSDQAQLDFVYFIDAQEKGRRAFVADEQGFLETHKRTKWDLLLQ